MSTTATIQHLKSVARRIRSQVSPSARHRVLQEYLPTLNEASWSNLVRSKLLDVLMETNTESIVGNVSLSLRTN